MAATTDGRQPPARMWRVTEITVSLNRKAGFSADHKRNGAKVEQWDTDEAGATMTLALEDDEYESMAWDYAWETISAQVDGQIAEFLDRRNNAFRKAFGYEVQSQANGSNGSNGKG